jgi:hypothetical protein
MPLSFLSQFKQHIKLFIPIIAINAFGLIGLYFFMPRPLLYIEYLVVLSALVVFKNYWKSFALFIIIFIFDIFYFFSSLFLFQIREFFYSIRFLNQYHFNFQHILIAILLFTYLLLIKYVLKKSHNLIQVHKKLFIKILACVYFIIFFFDMLSGSNMLTEKFIAQDFSKKNIIGTFSKEYFKLFTSFGNGKLETLNDTSIGFKAFLKDTTGNQMLIVVESWGELKDAKLQKELDSWIAKKFENKGYAVNIGKTKTYGSTVAAGLRELTNTRGDYSFYLNKKSVETPFKSIFDEKKLQRYETFGFHPYTAKMFLRSVWWKNIGIQNLYFKEQYLLENSTKENLVKGEANYFPSVKDEIFFDYVLNKTKKTPKKFVYFLTVNSHIPYNAIKIDNSPTNQFDISKMDISSQAKNQLTHIKNLLEYFSQKIESKDWNKILIVGDHMPPFPTNQDRNFYVDGKVPYLIITKH